MMVVLMAVWMAVWTVCQTVSTMAERTVVLKVGQMVENLVA